jgi:hypothetical protein
MPKSLAVKASLVQGDELDHAFSLLNARARQRCARHIYRERIAAARSYLFPVCSSIFFDSGLFVYDLGIILGFICADIFFAGECNGKREAVYIISGNGDSEAIIRSRQFLRVLLVTANFLMLPGLITNSSFLG